MRALKAAVIIMGVLIVAGTVVVAVTIANRLGNRPPPPAVSGLGEPAGSRILGIAATGDRLAVHVTGGGADDRIVIVDPASHRVLGRLVPGTP
ncbi:DUF6476 family protein [Elioraea tepidiphila]|jgi:hypothetical protein|uniref:DUF6476 family protein n=1 Tax=Elioraea tepidiphila TaxID=457934 RepID=UPI0003614A0F|nr:DUF6476 family protein [Elioraea tepidiphila]